MDNLQILQGIFADSEGKRFGVGFTDGDYRDLVVVSDTHVMLDDTVWGVLLPPKGEEAIANEPGIQFHLQDVERVYDFDTKCLVFGLDVITAKNIP